MNSMYINKKNIKFLKQITLPCMSGIIMGLLQTYLDLPMLCFIGLVPLCISVLNEHSFSVYIKKISAFSLVYNLFNFHFLIKISDLVKIPKIAGILVSALVVLLLSVLVSLVFVLTMSVFQKITKGRVADSFAFAFLFVFGEYVMEIIPFVSFPWSRIELSCIGFLPFMQCASLFGGRIVGIIIVSINSLIAEGIKSFSYNKKAFTAFLSAVLIYSVTFGYGIIRMNLDISTNDLTKDEHINVLITQGSVMGAEKWGVSKNEVFAEYDNILKSVDLNSIDLVVMPETALCENINQSSVTPYLKSISKDTDTVIATGSFYYDDNTDKRYNTLSYINPNSDEVLSYYKQRLVPFGEYVPFGKLLSEKPSLETGDEIKVIHTELGETASVVCIESIYSSISRGQVKNGGKIILVSTNDSWFENTSARNQHFNHSVLRAIENGRYVLRAANCGISAVITPNGLITDIISGNDTGKIISKSGLISKRTLYTMTGEWFWCVSLILILFGLNKMIKQKYNYRFLNRV